MLKNMTKPFVSWFDIQSFLIFFFLVRKILAHSGHLEVARMCLLISGWMYVALVFFLLIFMYAREEAVSHGHIPVNAAEREGGGRGIF